MIGPGEGRNGVAYSQALSVCAADVAAARGGRPQGATLWGRGRAPGGLGWGWGVGAGRGTLKDAGRTISAPLRLCFTRQVAMTSNGIVLGRQLPALKAAGAQLQTACPPAPPFCRAACCRDIWAGMPTGEAGRWWMQWARHLVAPPRLRRHPYNAEAGARRHGGLFGVRSPARMQRPAALPPENHSRYACRSALPGTHGARLARP